MGRQTDIDTIRRLIAARDAAVANNDAEAAIRPLARDVVVYDLQPPLAFVGDDARDAQALRAWLATWKAPGPRVEFHESRILVDGDLAVAHGFNRLRGDKIGEGPVELWFRTTLVFARSADGWRVVHDHDSVPMEMDGSGLAAVHLKP